MSARSRPVDPLDQIAERLDRHGLRPVVDREMALVIADCPQCHAERTDPWGIWRPLMVTRRGRTLRFHCAGCDREVVRRVD